MRDIQAARIRVLWSGYTQTCRKGVRSWFAPACELSLDIKVITTLNAMGVKKSELFEELLQQYEPFLAAWSELGKEDAEEDEDE